MTIILLAKDREGRLASPAEVVAAGQPFAAGADLAGLSGTQYHSAVPAA